jgi:glycine C-acetyltransferase/8-amino-7-oxononanoate synthase
VGLRNAEGAARSIVTDSVFSMDGDVAPLARDRRARAAPPRARRRSTRPTAPAASAPAGAARCTRPASRTTSTSSSARSARRSAPTARTRPATTHGPAAAQHARARSSSPPRRRPRGGRCAGALELLAEQPQRVDKLQANGDTLRDELAREGFEVAGSTTQIVPLVIGDAKQAMRICELAIERGVFAQAIRPPTVPRARRACAWP